MPRFARRSLGALAFVLTLLRVLAPELGHQCAMDTAPARMPVAAVAAAPDAHGGASPAAHGAHAAHVEDAAVPASGANSHHAPAESSDGGCDCADWCCCVPTVADTPRSTVALATVVTEAAAVSVSHRREAPRGAVVRLLPFATAPPAA